MFSLKLTLLILILLLTSSLFSILNGNGRLKILSKFSSLSKVTCLIICDILLLLI